MKKVKTDLVFTRYLEKHPSFTGMLIDCNGDKFWFQKGEFHREDGPAIECADGYKEWYHNGELHREDGPAREFPDGRKEWWIEDRLVTEEKHKNWVRRKKLEVFLDEDS